MRRGRGKTFRAYIDNVTEKTAKAPEDFCKLAKKKGLVEAGTKATQIFDWLRAELDLGSVTRGSSTSC